MDYFHEMRHRLGDYKKLGENTAWVAFKIAMWNVFLFFKPCKYKVPKKKQENISELYKKTEKEKEAKQEDMAGKISWNEVDTAKLVLEVKREKIEHKIVEIKNRLQSERQEINVVFITDSNYVYPTCIAITSLYYNANPGTNYHVFVVGVELKQEEIEVLEASGKYVSVILEEQLRIRGEFSHAHVTKGALYKFKLCEILDVLDKVLYLDSDMLFLGDLWDLYNTDVTEVYAAVVKDYHVYEIKKEFIKNNMELDSYFNSGMMLLNLKKLRNDVMPDKLMNVKLHLDEHNSLGFMDQDALNIGFGNTVKYLSPEYNFLQVYYKDFSPKELAKKAECASYCMYSIYRNPKILHLGGSIKVWNNVLGERRALYSEYEFINELYRNE